MRLTNCACIPEGQEIFLLPTIQTSSGAHSAYCSLGSEGLLSGDRQSFCWGEIGRGVRSTTNRLMLRLRMNGALPHSQRKFYFRLPLLWDLTLCHEVIGTRYFDGT